jgi:Secretin and TonB N terminus short domain
MRGRAGVLLTALAVLVATPGTRAHGQNARPPIVLEAGRLADALRTLSSRTGVNLLFSPEDIGDRRSPRVVGDPKDVEQILRQLLAGSGLSFQRLPSGDFVVKPTSRADDVDELPYGRAPTASEL